MTEQNSEAIAYGSVLAILLTSKQPVVVTVTTLAARLQLTPQAVTVALKQLEENGRISQVISRTIVQVVDSPAPVPTEPATDSLDQEAWEASTQAQLDAEAAEAKAAKKGGAK